MECLLRIVVGSFCVFVLFLCDDFALFGHDLYFGWDFALHALDLNNRGMHWLLLLIQRWRRLECWPHVRVDHGLRVQPVYPRVWTQLLWILIQHLLTPQLLRRIHITTTNQFTIVLQRFRLIFRRKLILWFLFTCQFWCHKVHVIVIFQVEGFTLLIFVHFLLDFVEELLVVEVYLMLLAVHQ